MVQYKHYKADVILNTSTSMEQPSFGDTGFDIQNETVKLAVARVGNQQAA